MQFHFPQSIHLALDYFSYPTLLFIYLQQKLQAITYLVLQ